MPRKKPRARYGDYCEIIDGALYASVNIPLGNGKYRKKRKRVENTIEARQWALATLYGKVDPNQTFSELVKWYKAEFLIPPVYQKGKRVDGVRTYQRSRTAADRLVRYFGNFKLDDITVDVLRRYKRERLQKVSITAVNRDFALMRTMFRRAVNRKWLKENPFDHSEGLIEVSLEPKGRAPITHRTAKRLLARSRKSEQPLLHYLLLVLAHTGARPSEVFPYDAKQGDGILREPLIWQRVLQHDFKAVTLVSYKGRVREERIVPASEQLERGLRALHERTGPNPDDLLFPFSSCKRAWATLCRSVGVKVTLRAFRAYFNTYLIERNFNEISRMMILGQKKIVTNLRYTSITPEMVESFRRQMS